MNTRYATSDRKTVRPIALRHPNLGLLSVITTIKAMIAGINPKWGATNENNANPPTTTAR